MAEKPDKVEISKRFREVQTHICDSIAVKDGGTHFSVENWEHQGGGGGTTRILQNGTVLEKAGVNFSAVEGTLTKEMAASIGVEVSAFFATGVSIVMHPHNPHVPIIHMNIRYFETEAGVYWFGGGIDLTPHYVDPAQARYFHEQLKAVCDRYDVRYYEKFKTWADNYFFNAHRNETRGVGGIFYDHLQAGEKHSKEDIFNFSIALGQLFPDLYGALIDQNRDKAFSEAEKQWQLLRRGRYVEFNLVYDRGTRFGLFGNGRVESILMSLPSLAAWEYNHQVTEGSPEAHTLSCLRKGVDWLREV